MYEKFTDRARKVMQIAQHEAQRLHHEAVASEHVLLGLAREASGVASNVLKQLQVDFRKVRSEAEKHVPLGRGGRSEAKVPLSQGVKQLVEYAREEAGNLGHNHIGTEHLLLALLRVNEGVVPRILANLGLHPETIRESVQRILGVTSPPSAAGTGSAMPGSVVPVASPSLHNFTRDLTALAKEGKLEPLRGRTAEIDEVVQIVSCLQRHRVLLIGEPGVGKRAILHGLASRLAGQVFPEGMPSRLLKLEIALLLTSQHQVPPAEHLHTVLSEARTQNAILALEGLPLLLTSWNGSLGTLFRTWLSSGTGAMVATVTGEEFHTLARTDRALLDQFEWLRIEPPAMQDVLAILRDLRPRYEAHHRVKIGDDALLAAVANAEHLSGLKLPGSALRLLDRAAARLRLQSATKPSGVQELETEIIRLEREKECAVVDQDFEKAASLRDKVEKRKARKEQAIREWEAVAGAVPECVDARAVNEMAGQLGRHAPG